MLSYPFQSETLFCRFYFHRWRKSDISGICFNANELNVNDSSKEINKKMKKKAGNLLIKYKQEKRKKGCFLFKICSHLHSQIIKWSTTTRKKKTSRYGNRLVICICNVLHCNSRAGNKKVVCNRTWNVTGTTIGIRLARCPFVAQPWMLGWSPGVYVPHTYMSIHTPITADNN